jgi:hypothetical protein
VRRGWAVLAFVLALAACDASAGDPPPGPASTTPGLTAEAWADNLCGVILDYDAGAGRLEIDPSSQAATISSLVKYLDGMSSRITITTDNLQNLGPAPIPGGDEAAQAIVGSLQRIAHTVNLAKSRLSGIDPNDRTAAAATLKEVATSLQDLRAPVNPLEGMGARYPEFQAAVRAAPNCGEVIRARSSRAALPPLTPTTTTTPPTTTTPTTTTTPVS